ncbi:MAG: hypothetical protein EOO85_11185 [Pedobacter sp.]|nr:MAG: hypothetical protein EOO85_11185 [Pedobacter sp.]
MAILAKFKFINRGGGIVSTFTDFNEIKHVHPSINAELDRREISIGQVITIERVAYRVYSVFTVILPETTANNSRNGISSSVKGALFPYNVEIQYYMDVADYI